MLNIDLNGQWELFTFTPGNSVETTSDLNDYIPIAATVPGNVELDLERAGVLPPLFEGCNIRELRTYERHEWWYRKTFTLDALPDHSAVFEFEGVDCYAYYYLNGELIGGSDNMLIAHTLHAEGLKLGENELCVRIFSPIKIAEQYDYDTTTSALATNYESLHVRKAPASYGWDIMCRAVTSGIWRGVCLHEENHCRIEQLYMTTDQLAHTPNGLAAHIGIRYQVHAHGYDGLVLRILGEYDGKSAFVKEIPVRFTYGNATLTIENPHLWWPKGYGEAALYHVKAELVDHEQTRDCWDFSLGVRSVQLDRTDITTQDKPGEFRFLVNDIPIMCKGSNWVPLDAFHSRDAQRYDMAMALVADSGCNILRCWGGNVYEDHAFYDACDRLGVLIWQDFSMACALYPTNQNFQDRLRIEAKAVVRKLRQHACIALWSGDNECDYNYLGRGLDPNTNPLTRVLLPQVVREQDGTRPYLPSSPYFAPSVVAHGVEGNGGTNSDLMPEQHLWGPRDYFKGPFYSNATAHFVSETGYHGCPNRSSMQKFLTPDGMWPYEDNDEWIIHASDSVGRGGPYAYRVALMAKQIREMFGTVPDNLVDFIVASQISQAEAKKHFIELTRNNKWRRTGVIWWNLLDGWPQFSDAVVDYYGGKKLAYHYIKRVQSPFCVMVTEPANWQVQVIAGNDTQTVQTGNYRVWDAETDETLLEGSFSVGSNENFRLGAIPVSHGSHRLFLIEWNSNGLRGVNHYMLGHPPFELAVYKRWLNHIAQLDGAFAAGEVGK